VSGAAPLTFELILCYTDRYENTICPIFYPHTGIALPNASVASPSMELTLGHCQTDYFSLGNPGVLWGKVIYFYRSGFTGMDAPLSQILDFDNSLVDSISSWQWQQEDVMQIQMEYWASHRHEMAIKGTFYRSILKPHVQRLMARPTMGGS